MTQWAGVLRLLRRRVWALVITTTLVLVIAVALSPREREEHTAEANLFVPSGANREGPGNAFDANRLALTYVSLIPRDQAILGFIARTISEPVSTVRAQLRVSTIGDTSILRVAYTSSSAAKARAAVRAAAQIITAEVGAGETIPAGTVVLASLSEQAPENGPAKSGVVGVGAVLGLGLGVVVAVAWERADARVDDIDQLEAVTFCPASALDELSPASAAALLDRLRSLANSGSTLRSSMEVALLAASPGQLELNREVGSLLNVLATLAEGGQRSDGAPAPSERVSESGDEGSSQPTSSSPPTPEKPGSPSGLAQIVLLPTGSPTHGEGGELLAMQSDLVVLVVAAGTRVHHVTETITRLKEFQAAPSWVLFVSAAARKRLVTFGSGDPGKERIDRRWGSAGEYADSAGPILVPETAEPGQRLQGGALSGATATVGGTSEVEDSDSAASSARGPASGGEAIALCNAAAGESGVRKASGDDQEGTTARSAEEAWTSVLDKVYRSPQDSESGDLSSRKLHGHPGSPPEDLPERELRSFHPTSDDAAEIHEAEEKDESKANEPVGELPPGGLGPALSAPEDQEVADAEMGTANPEPSEG